MRLNISLGFTSILTLIFITLKLTGNIDWSWWLVLAPTILSIAIGLIFFAIFMIAFIVAVILV